jgi:hypothetical protein
MPYTHPITGPQSVLETSLEHPRWHFVAGLVLTLFSADWYLSATLSRADAVALAEHEARIHIQSQVDYINQNCRREK